MGVSLFTSRIVLRELGVSDYGIYSLVGGIVALFGFFNAAMSSATQRYLSFDIGKGDQEKLRKTFSASLTIHAGIALLVLILAETIGLWYVNYKMVFPPERNFAVNVVYQFSVFSFLLGIIQVPYNALIIARERMNVYAYVSILEVILKLIIVFMLVFFGSDKLITYAILTFVVSFIIRVIYQVYCRKHFKESKYKFEYDKEYYRELMSYSGWNLFGTFAVVGRTQGANVLLNLFFGPVVNAAFGLSTIVQGVVGSFVSNFQTAVNPQITINFAKGNGKFSKNLVFKSSKFSFYAMLLMILPLFYNIEFALKLWLGEVPMYLKEFLRLTLIFSLMETLSNPLITLVQATGKIKWYQITLGLFIFLTIPFMGIILRITNDPFSIYYVLIINSFLAMVIRVMFLHKLIDLDLKEFFNEVLIRIAIVVSLIVVFMYFMILYFKQSENIIIFLVQTIFILFVSLMIIYIFGLDIIEKNILKRILLKKLKRNG